MAQKKGYIKRTTEQRLKNESLFSEFSRYQYAKDEIDKLNAEIKQKKEEREQKIREREQEYDASMRGDSVSKPVDLGQSVQLEQRDSTVDQDIRNTSVSGTTSSWDNDEKQPDLKSNKKDGMGVKAFFSSLWVSLLNSLRTPLPTSAPALEIQRLRNSTPSTMQGINTVNRTAWTADAASAYGIQKNKVEIENYTGEIVLNKEKLQYANVIKTYADNLQEYIDLKTLYDLIPSNTPEGKKTRADLYLLMSKLVDWMQDLDESMRVAQTYNLDYDEHPITSYSGSIGAPVRNKSLTSDAKRLLNAFDYIKRDRQSQLKNIKEISLIVNDVKKNYDKFSGVIGENIEEASRKMDEEYEDLRDWEEWHTPSAEFRAREKAAQKNYFSDWDTYAASLPGQIGSSMSFGGLQMLSTGLNLAGAVAVRTPNPYIAAGGVASTLLGAAAGIASGAHENKSEVGSNYKDAVIKELQDKDLYEDFMHDMEYQMKKKKLPYHDDEEDKMTDAFNYFLRGDIQSNDQRVRDIARKHLFGAANLFQNDMMAVSADVAFDTTLNLFVPGGGVAKALRITPVGKFNEYSRTLAKISSDHPLIGKVIRRANAVESGIGTQVADAISPAVGRLYRASKVAVPQLNKLHAGVEKFANGMKKGAAKVASFALNSPDALYKAGNYAAGVLNFGGQLISRGFSEAIEEGKQYEYGERFKSGGFAGKSNSILETILDDMSTGTSTALAFVGSQFLGIDSDSDLMANMRGGFIGSIFNHGTLISAYQQGNDVYRKAKAGDIIAQNLMLKRIQERSDIMNAMQFAKYAQQPSKIAAMNEAFDRFIYIQEQLQNNAKDDNSQQYWTREDIESQRKKFQDIVNLSNSGLIRHIMKNSGIDPSSIRGHAFIALVDYAQNKAQEDGDIANDHITEFNQLLDSNRLSVDALGNIKSIVDNIKDIENSLDLTAEEIEYLKQLYNEAREEDEANAPEIKPYWKKNKQKRIRQAYRKDMHQRIADRIKRVVEFDKYTDAQFAKHYALLKLQRELQSIPSELRTNQHKNQLASINAQILEFLGGMNEQERLVHSIQTEESLYELGKNRGFFNLIADAYRTVALDKVSMLQNTAMLLMLFGPNFDSRLLKADAVNAVMQEASKDTKLMKYLQKNLFSNKTKDAADVGVVIDKLLDGVEDDYKLYKRILDAFLESLKIFSAQDAEDNTPQNHLTTYQEPTRKESTTAIADLEKLKLEAAKQQARRDKRKRNKQNRRAKQEYWGSLQDAWEEPENDQLIHELIDPADFDELDTAHGEPVSEGTLDDYISQYEDAYEEPWWDELMAERKSAEDEEAAFYELYKNNDDILSDYNRKSKELSEKYKNGTIVTIAKGDKTVMYQVVGQIYNEKSGSIEFAIHKITKKMALAKNAKPFWVSRDDISNYNVASILQQFDFLQPTSMHGITVGDKENLYIENANGDIVFVNLAEVIDFTDDGDIIYRTISGETYTCTYEQWNQYKNKYASATDAYETVKRQLAHNFDFDDVRSVYIDLQQGLPEGSRMTVELGIRVAYGVLLMNSMNVVPEYDNRLDTFVRNEQGDLVRFTKATQLIQDMYELSPLERMIKQGVMQVFSLIPDKKHALGLLHAWYHDTLDMNDPDAIQVKSILKDSPVEKGNLDLTPYIILAENGRLDIIALNNISDLLAKPFNTRETRNSTTVINEIIDSILDEGEAQPYESNDEYKRFLSKEAYDSLVAGVNEFVLAIEKQGASIQKINAHIIFDDYSCEYNHFVLYPNGDIKQLHFPVRWYNYVENLDDINMTAGPIRKLKIKTERQWLQLFELLSGSLLSVAFPDYKGILQIPFTSITDRKVRRLQKVTALEKLDAVSFDASGDKLQPLTEDERAKYTEKLKQIKDSIDRQCSAHDMYQLGLRFVDDIDQYQRAVYTIYGQRAPKEYYDALMNYAASVQQYINKRISDIQDALNVALNPQQPRKRTSSPSIDALLPKIRQDIQNVLQIIQNINRYTRTGGMIDQQTKLLLEAFLANESNQRYYEKLNGSQLQSDKQLALQVNVLRNQVQAILQNHPIIYGNSAPDTSAPVLDDNTLIMSPQARLELANIMFDYDFATTAEAKVVYGILNPNTKEITKLDAPSTDYHAGLYITISYKEKTLSPIKVLPSHYSDSLNTLTENGINLIQKVIGLQQNGDVFVTGLHRTIPNVHYGNQQTAVQNVPSLGFTEQNLQMLDGNSDLVGMCRTAGKITKLVSTQSSSPLYTLQESKQSSNIGGCFLFVKFPFGEYKNDTAKVPVRLVNAKMLNGDYDVIVSILKTVREQFQKDSYINLDEYYKNLDGETPFTLRQVMNFLVSFSQDSNRCRIYLNNDGTVQFRDTVSGQFGKKLDVLNQMQESEIRQTLSQLFPYVYNHVATLTGKLADDSNPIYSKLYSYIEQHKTLHISPNLSFDELDLNMNGEGFYGIGWAIRHGRLRTTATSIYEPMVGFDDVSNGPSMPLGEAEPIAPPEPPTPGPEELRIDDFDEWYRLNIGTASNTSAIAPSTVMYTNRPLDPETALNNLRRMFGDLPVSVFDTFIPLMSQNPKCVGGATLDAILLSKLAAYGTEYHEAFHRVVELLIGENKRNKVYKIYQKRAPGATVQQLAEYMAEDFRLFMTEQKPESLHFTWNLLNLFRQIKEWISAIRGIGSFRLAYLYYRINNGAYANVLPTEENAIRFNKIFGGVAPMTMFDPKTHKDITLNNVSSSRDFNEAIESICHGLIDLFLKDDETFKVEDVDLSAEGIKTTEAYKNLVGENKSAAQKAFSEIFENWDISRTHLFTKLKLLGLGIHQNKKTGKIQLSKSTLDTPKDVDKLDDEQQHTKEGAIAEMMDYITKESYEISRSAKIKEYVRFMLSNIVDEHYVDIGDLDDEGRQLPLNVVAKNEHGQYVDVNDNPATYNGKEWECKQKDGTVLRGKEIRWKTTRNIVKSKNVFGLDKYLSFDEVYNRLLTDLHHINNIPDLIEGLRKLSENSIMYKQIYNKIIKMYNNMLYVDNQGFYQDTNGTLWRKTNRLSPDGKVIYIKVNDEKRPVKLPKEVAEKRGVVYKVGEEYFMCMEEDQIPLKYNWNNVARIALVFNAISGSKLNYKMLITHRESPSSVTHQYTDTDAGHTARRYTQQWFLSFVNDSRRVDSFTSLSGVLKHRTKNAQLFNELGNFIQTLVDVYVSPNRRQARSDVFVYNGVQYSAVLHVEQIKSLLVQKFNSVGIQISKKVFDYLLYTTFGDTGYAGLYAYLCQNGDDIGVKKGVSVSKFLLSIKECQDNGVFGVALENGKFYTASGFVSQLANAKYQYNISNKESRVIAPGNNSYYEMSEKNTITFMTEELSDSNSQFLNDVRDCPYYTYVDPVTGVRKSTFILKHVLTGDYKVVFDNFVGYRNDDIIGDYGSDYMQIGSAEDLISKIEILEDNNMIFPAMSNKKTYGSISIVDKNGRKVELPGIHFVSNKRQSDELVYRATNLPMLVPTTVGNGEVVPDGDYSKFTFVLPSDVYTQLIDYAMMEYEGVKYGNSIIGQLEDGEKVDNLHKASGKTGQSSAGICRFPRFYGVFTPIVTRDDNGKIISVKRKFENFNDNNESDEDNLKKAEKLFFGQNVSDLTRRAYINELIMNQLDKWLDHLEQAGIITKRAGWQRIANPYLRYESDILDFNQLNAVIKELPTTVGGQTLSKNDTRSLGIVTLLLDVMIKHQISMEEIQRCYLGHPGEFETYYDKESGRITDDQKDMSKRAGGEVSTGETNAIGIAGISDSYVCSEINDYKVSSPQYKDFKSSFYNSELRYTLYYYIQQDVDRIFERMKGVYPTVKNLPSYHEIATELYKKYGLDALPIVDEIENILATEEENVQLRISNTIKEWKHDLLCLLYDKQKAYSLQKVEEELDKLGILSAAQTRAGSYAASYEKGINVGDGASYISPKMVKNLLLQLGLFKGDVVKAYDYLNKGISEDVLADAKACSIIMNAMLGSQKYTAYGYRMHKGFPEFYYHKTALFPMFKQLCTTPKLKRIYDLMTKTDPLSNDKPIDMLLFKSSAKVGSRGSQKFPETEKELGDFKPNTYDLKFKFLIKQLNTDPKDREYMAAGTLALKVVMSIINQYASDYQLRGADGYLTDLTISGTELRDRIMQDRKAIIELKVKQLAEKFFEETGSKNQLEFIAWMTSNLTDRDASDDFLRALSFDENGKRKAKLSAISDGGWVQSITASLVNKELIDFNLPGNMFIQRSVFGMEGKVLSSKYVPALNDGNRLKLVNEQGSMDAAISVDYFVEMFPELKNMSFKQQRKWLMDKNIIGPKAKALCVSYRIPTQAASSIAALRIVDVIPVVRDTIVLPEEFTALTGSDFDIDKLFFSFKNIHLDENGNLSEDYPKGSLEFYQNRVIESFITLLQQSRDKVGNITLRSIDNDTEIGESVAKELKSGKLYVDPYDAMALWRQSQIKEDNRTGSVGIGPSALNNSNHNHTRLYDVHFVNTRIIRELGISNLSAELDDESKSVLGLLGAYINGHVDNAKNPWVATVGLNPYSYNVANLLARCGFGRRSLYFTAQPIMKELSKIHNYSTGTLYRTRGETAYEMEDRLVRELEEKYFLSVSGGGIDADIKDIIRAVSSGMDAAPGARSDNERLQRNIEIIRETYDIIKHIVGVTNAETLRYGHPLKRKVGETEVNDTIIRDVANITAGMSFYDVMRMHDKMYSFEIDGKKIELSVAQVQFYVHMLGKMLEPYSRAMSNMVQYTKIDTKKQGRSIAQQWVYRYNYEKLKTSKAFDDGLIDMLLNSYIDTLTTEATDIYHRLLEDEFIEAIRPMSNLPGDSQTRITWLLQFLEFSATPSINEKTVSAAINGITSYIKNRYFLQYAKNNNISIRDLFIGPNSIYNELWEIKTMIQENPELYKEYVDYEGDISNELLSLLEPSVIDSEKYDLFTVPKFVEIIKNDDESASINAIRNAWTLLLTDTKHPELQDFAKRLVVYAFITSGDTNVNGSIFRYVPYYWRETLSKQDNMDKSYVEYINDFIDQKNMDHDMLPGSGAISICNDFRNDTVYKDVLLNNWNIHELVPTLYNEATGESKFLTICLDKQKGTPDVLIAATVKILPDAKGVFRTRIIKSTYNKAPLVVKIPKHGAFGKTRDDYYFYQLYSYGTSIKQDGTVFNYPIYTLINPKGYYYYGHKIFEYGGVFGIEDSAEDYFVDKSKLAPIESIVEERRMAAEKYTEVLNSEGGGMDTNLMRQIITQLFMSSEKIDNSESGLIRSVSSGMAIYDTFLKKVKSKGRYEDAEAAELGSVLGKNSKILYAGHVVSREEALANPRTMYIFTDNTNRTSGKIPVPRDSWYYRQYGDGQTDLYYPENSTRAVLRGLHNAYPISTQRFYDIAKGLTGKAGNWTNDDLDEFKRIIDKEFDNILFWAKNFDNIVISGDSLFGGAISDIKEEGDRSEIYKYLKLKLEDLFVSINGIGSNGEYFYPGKPTLNAIPNWQPGSIYYAGVGSRETPQDVLDQMKEVAQELEANGYILRSGHADGADLAFSSGVRDFRNKKEYTADDIKFDHFGTAEQASKLYKETHPATEKIESGSKGSALLIRNGYQVFGEKLDSPSAFVLCWTKDGAIRYDQTSADTGGTGQAIRLASMKGIPVINMANPAWREQLNEVLKKNKPTNTREIWWGRRGEGPNANLSNFAIRSFRLTPEVSDRINSMFESKSGVISVSELINQYMNGRKFISVEQAFQFIKFAGLYVHLMDQDVFKDVSAFLKYASEEEHLAARREVIRNRIEKLRKKRDISEELAAKMYADEEENVHRLWYTRAHNAQSITSDQRSMILDAIRYNLTEISNVKTSSEAKQLGKKRIPDIYGTVYNYFNGIWSNTKGHPDITSASYKVMGLLQIDSFRQNKTALEELLATGNDMLLHSNGGEWKTLFPQALTRTRNYFINNPIDQTAPPFRTSLVIADSSSYEDMKLKAEAVGGVITTRQHGEEYHYGNPFSHNPKWGIVTGDGTIADAVKAFDQWLGGTAYQDVEPERRQWILDTINAGMLDDTPLVYYTTHATDSLGDHVYDYKKFPNHAHILLKYINMHIAYPDDFVERFASPLQAKTTLESVNTILSTDELKMWNDMGITNPKILVASEHTDPAFFADQLVNVIEGKESVDGWKQDEKGLTGKDFSGLYIITKHDGLPLKKILQTKIPKIIHFSITGLGGTIWEPGVMRYNDLLDRIGEYIKQGLDPKWITVRIDPIIPGITSPKDIEEIMRRCSEMGIKRIKFSICDMYAGGIRKLRRDGTTVTTLSTIGPILQRAEQYYGKEGRQLIWDKFVQNYGLDEKHPERLNFHAKPETMNRVCNLLISLADKYGLELHTCAEPINHPKIKKDGCLSVEQVNEMLGTHFKDDGGHQRKLCPCFGGKVDMFDYGDKCYSCCAYCYASHALDKTLQYYNADGTLKDNRFTRTTEAPEDLKQLVKFDKEALKEMGAKVLEFCNNKK